MNRIRTGAGSWTQYRMQGRIEIDREWRGVICWRRSRGIVVDIGIRRQDGSKDIVWGRGYWWESAKEKKKEDRLTGCRKSLVHDVP